MKIKKKKAEGLMIVIKINKLSEGVGFSVETDISPVKNKITPGTCLYIAEPGLAVLQKKVHNFVRKTNWNDFL